MIGCLEVISQVLITYEQLKRKKVVIVSVSSEKKFVCVVYLNLNNHSPQ